MCPQIFVDVGKKGKRKFKIGNGKCSADREKYGFKENKLTAFFYNYPPICKGDFIGK